MKALRIGLVAVGVLAVGWGCWLMMSRQDLEQLLSAVVWLIAVVVVHDGSVAALSVAGLGRRKTRSVGIEDGVSLDGPSRRRRVLKRSRSPRS